MDIKQILARKGRDVHTIAKTATIVAALDALAQRCIGALVVVDTDGGIAGIISERDIVRALEHKGTATLASLVADFMTSKVVTCTEGATDIEIMQLMTESTFRHVPVTQSGHLCGIVSIAFGLSFAALIFSGPLTPWLAYGIAASFVSSGLWPSKISSISSSVLPFVSSNFR